MASRVSTPVDLSLSALQHEEEDDGSIVFRPAREELMRDTALKIKDARADAKAANDARDAAVRAAEVAQKRVEALMKELKAAQDDAVLARRRGASLFEDNINQKKENQELKKKHEEALADAHNLRLSLEVFKRIKMELEAKILQLQGAALQPRHATPVKEPKGKQPTAWAVKGFEEMMSYTDARPPRAQLRMQRVTATGAGPSSYAPAYAPAYDELPDDAFPVY
jgi:hypothetical protein